MLLVFDPNLEGKPENRKSPGKRIFSVKGPWDVTFEHVNGQSFKRSFNELKEFGTSAEPQLNSFAGSVTYSTSFYFNESAGWIGLEKVNKGITEVFLNGQALGLNWYGNPIFETGNALKSGENKLEIKYTSVLSNYVMSLENNPTAEKWTAGFKKIPMGLEEAPAIY